MSWMLVELGISLILGTVFAQGQVTVENGGYTNVVVSFSQNVAEAGVKTLLPQLKDDLKEASQALQTAVGLRISDVTVVIPRSLDTTGWEEDIAPSSTVNPRADILVSSVSDTVFGPLPHTLQHAPCGSPGHQIVVPTEFVSGDSSGDFPKGTLLAREWLKYRYGVFDENGYSGDELYPLYYRIPGLDEGDAIVTDCSDKKIEYVFKDNGENCSQEDLFSKACKPEPLAESLENVTSSLMYYHEHVPKMQHVCGRSEDHPHNSLARNKQNALCRGQSVWDVLKNSMDSQHLQNLTNETTGEDAETIKFTYVWEPRQKVVIAWENTLNMEKQKTLLPNTIKKFVYELPKGTKRALLPFVDKVDEKNYVDLSELVNWPADWSNNLKSTFANPSKGCIECALNKALDMFHSDQSDVGKESIILIASAASSAEMSEESLGRIQNFKGCLILLVFHDEEAEKIYEELAMASNCGTLVQIRNNLTNLEIFKEASTAMESILPAAVHNRATETIETKEIEEKNPLEIHIDSSVEKVAIWTLSEIELDQIDATFNDLEVLFEEEISESIIKLTFSPKTEGLLRLKLKYGSALMQVRVTSKLGEYVTGEVFTLDLTKDGATQEPVVLYTALNYGAYPIQNAKVLAAIQKPGGKFFQFQLFDSGIDPDITANDGVYSRYFTSQSEGDYSLTVAAIGRNLTTIGQISNKEPPAMCCGRSAAVGSTEIKSLVKVFKTTFSTKSGRPENTYKPSRIVDLRVQSMTEGNLTLEWTAPGGIADKGIADGYNIKYFESQEIQDFDQGKLLKQMETFKSWGTKEETTIDKKQFDGGRLYYIAIQAYNKKLNSETSNIVEVFVSKAETTTVPNVPDTKRSHPDKETITIAIGVIFGVLVLAILLYLIVYFTVTRPKRKARKAEVEARPSRTNQQSNDKHAMNPITFVPVDTLIKHHSDKTRAKIENKEPTILKEEDFEQSLKNTENSVASINERQGESSMANKTPENPLYPSKSPKRTTHV